ncbi:MAG: hypothetical protein KJO79_01980, partial [Verrucomicrobiae bacterium]|nr:hypothetical protein [Verrucomicrobiae bacterium]NNJ85920.1 hypothetical protein [Akkermansiaceae bacterium]
MKPLDAADLARADYLIQTLEDGVISVDDRQELMNLMREHASVRELYLKHTEMVALLKESAESRVQLGTMPVSEEFLKYQRRKSAMVSLTVGIAAILLVSVGFLIFQVSQRITDDQDWIVMEQSVDAKYAISYSDREDRDTRTLEAGDKISLKQGLVQLTFPSGVEAIIEGPSEVKLISDLSVKMDGGLA